MLDGGAGTDTASYALAHAGVTVNLGVSGPQETFGAGIDTLVNIENLTGSAFDDTLIGNAGANVLSGGLGNDVLVGGGGGDTMSGHAAGAVNPTDINTYVYNAPTNSVPGANTFDTITDFTHGVDKIDFSALVGLRQRAGHDNQCALDDRCQHAPGLCLRGQHNPLCQPERGI